MVSGVGSLYYSGSMHGSSFLCVYLFLVVTVMTSAYRRTQDPGGLWSIVSNLGSLGA
jgi:hypothetical protein